VGRGGGVAGLCPLKATATDGSCKCHATRQPAVHPEHEAALLAESTYMP